VGGDAAPRVHTEIQGKLRDIGVHEGFDVWVADRGIPYADGLLGEGCLTDLPVVAPERTRVAMRNIDVIWFRSGTGIPDRLYEIENSTTVYSGLLRFNDVMIDYPLERTFIVGGDDRTRRKFEREIQRRTFEKSGLSLVTKYLDYEAIRGLWRSYRSLGSGSSSWG
jgi:type II restriction enzyme